MRWNREDSVSYAEWAQTGVHISVMCFIVMMLRFMKRMNDERLRQEEMKTRKMAEAYGHGRIDKLILEAADDWFDDKPNSKVLLREVVGLKRQNRGMSDPTDRTIPVVKFHPKKGSK